MAKAFACTAFAFFLPPPRSSKIVAHELPVTDGTVFLKRCFFDALATVSTFCFSYDGGKFGQQLRKLVLDCLRQQERWSICTLFCVQEFTTDYHGVSCI